MAQHDRSIMLTDAEEKAWGFVLALTNAARASDDQLADVDALLDLRLRELTDGAVTQAFGDFEQRLVEAVKADPVVRDAVAVAANVPVEKPTPVKDGETIDAEAVTL